MLGYYALLGLESGSQGDTSDASIKTAFRQAALREHPDRHEVSLPFYEVSLDLAGAWCRTGL